jgi:hypothetical protein
MFFCKDYRNEDHNISGDYSSMSNKVCKDSTTDGRRGTLLDSKVSTRMDGMTMTKVKPKVNNKVRIRIVLMAKSKR